MDIVITCHPNGDVETVLKDQAFDTREVYGVTARQIDRISEILPTPNGMAFFVHWLLGPDANTNSTETFATYEAAVNYEVEQINHARINGISYTNDSAPRRAVPRRALQRNATHCPAPPLNATSIS